MSRKATAFKVVQPMPKTLAQYWVFVPYIIHSPLIVESATYPNEELGEVAVWLGGQQVFFPTKYKVGGSWECFITENALALNQISVDALKVLQSGRGNSVALFDIMVALTLADTMSPITSSMRVLKGCFLQSIAPIVLNASSPGDPLKWKLSFKYSYIYSL